MELIELLRGLLAKKPTQRLRIRDLRRDGWLTEGQKELLPEPMHNAVGKGELKDILQRGMVQLKGVKLMDSNVQANPDGSEGKRFVENVKQVNIAPKEEAKRGAPRGPDMLKR